MQMWLYTFMRNLTISFVIFFSLGYAISFFIPDADVRVPNTDITNDAINGGAYIEVVYIGASHCTPSNNSETHSNVKRIKSEIEQIFETSDSTSVIFKGIAINNVADQGVSFLEETGPYDEISSGLGVYNSSLDQYVWDNDSILPETPQIIINKV